MLSATRRGEEPWLLRHDGDEAGPALGGDLLVGSTVDEHGAGRRQAEPQQHLHERRLAAAGRTDDAEQLTPRDLEVDPPQRRLIPVAVGHVVQQHRTDLLDVDAAELLLDRLELGDGPVQRDEVRLHLVDPLAVGLRLLGVGERPHHEHDDRADRAEVHSADDVEPGDGASEEQQRGVPVDRDPGQAGEAGEVALASSARATPGRAARPRPARRRTPASRVRAPRLRPRTPRTDALLADESSGPPTRRLGDRPHDEDDRQTEADDGHRRYRARRSRRRRAARTGS